MTEDELEGEWDRLSDGFARLREDSPCLVAFVAALLTETGLLFQHLLEDEAIGADTVREMLREAEGLAFEDPDTDESALRRMLN